MPYVVRCPHCSKSCQIPDNAQGQAVRCPACSKPFRFPTLSPATAPCPQICHHFRVEEIQGVTVVGFQSWALTDRKNVQETGQGLRTLLASLHQRQSEVKLILNFSQVSFATSEGMIALPTALGGLPRSSKPSPRQLGEQAASELQTALTQAEGERVRVVLLVPPGPASTLLSRNALTRRFPVAYRMETAISAFEHMTILSCPVHGCGGQIPCPESNLRHIPLSPICRDCGTQLSVDITPSADSTEGEARAHSLDLPTYDEESIRVSFHPLPTLQVIGRLDLFASETLVRAWRTLPLPRKVLFNLSEITELSSAVSDALLELCAENDGNRGAILFHEDTQGRPEAAQKRQEMIQIFPAGSPVYRTRELAIQALGGIPEEANTLLAIKVSFQ